jgi:PQQ system protein
MHRSRFLILFSALTSMIVLAGCEYVRLLRPSVLKQLNPRVVRLVNELPEVDAPNKEIIGRLFAHGGLSHAKLGSDGAMSDTIRVPRDQLIWEPAIIVMPKAGELRLQFSNEDQAHHMAFVPNDGERVVVDLPMHTRGEARVHLSQPGLYWFGCPVANHAGRGMLGLIMVAGETPDTARLDRPRQKRP